MPNPRGIWASGREGHQYVGTSRALYDDPDAQGKSDRCRLLVAVGRTFLG